MSAVEAARQSGSHAKSTLVEIPASARHRATTSASRRRFLPARRCIEACRGWTCARIHSAADRPADSIKSPERDAGLVRRLIGVSLRRRPNHRDYRTLSHLLVFGCPYARRSFPRQPPGAMPVMSIHRTPSLTAKPRRLLPPHQRPGLS